MYFTTIVCNNINSNNVTRTPAQRDKQNHVYVATYIKELLQDMVTNPECFLCVHIVYNNIHETGQRPVAYITANWICILVNLPPGTYKYLLVDV